MQQLFRTRDRRLAEPNRSVYRLRRQQNALFRILAQIFGCVRGQLSGLRFPRVSLGDGGLPLRIVHEAEGPHRKHQKQQRKSRHESDSTTPLRSLFAA